MKKIKLFLTIIIPALFTFVSCEFGVNDETVSNLTKVTINGQVVDNNSGDALADASVKLSNGSDTVRTKTNSMGMFSAEFQLAEDTEMLIITSKQGYQADTTNYFVTISAAKNSPLIKLNPEENNVSDKSGGAASIYLYSQTEGNVGVKESGSNESVYFVFQVLDSTGTPININNKVLLNFLLSSGPGGGEYLYPAAKETNALGRAGVTLNSGTVAGVVQIIAEIKEGGRTIRSKPILISVYGGFPDIDHFDVACEKLNYPALGLIGFEIPFTAFVGDKYSNPVRPNTSVYFSTTSGIIDGSNMTDNLGRSTVTMLTQPSPNHSVYGPGFFEVTAKTVNENQQEIETSTIRLLSGKPIITVDPSTFDLSNGGSQQFTYTVSDVNNNPLSEGTSITVTVSEGDVKVMGDVEVKMPDTQSRTFTNFSFILYDAKPDSTYEHQAIIQIETTGANGDKKLSIRGTAR